MLRPVLDHHISHLIIHVVLNALSRSFLLWRLFTDDLGLDRARRREGLHHGLSLELNHGLCQQRVVHTTSTGPRLHPLFKLQAQQLQSIHVRLHPVLAAGNVGVVVLNKVTC